MSLYWIPILVSLVPALVGFCLKGRKMALVLFGAAMLILLIPLIQGNLFSFSYTSIFTLGFALMLILAHFLLLLPIKNAYMGSIIHYTPLLFGIVFSIPAIYIYGVQADNYKLYIYVAIAIGVVVGIGSPFLLFKGFWKKGVLDKILIWLFSILAFGVFSYCALSTIQSRFLLFYSIGLFALIACESIESFGLSRLSCLARFVSVLGAAIFVASPLLF